MFKTPLWQPIPSEPSTLAELELFVLESEFIADQEHKVASGESYGCPIHYQTTDGCAYCAAIVEIHGQKRP